MWINIWTTWVDEIYVWEWKQVDDYSAMRWPCPEGFHIPTINELQGIVSLLSSSFWISYSWDNLWQYLLMPFTGHRNGYRGSTTQQGSRWWYWSATWDSRGNAKAIYFTSGSGWVDSGYSDCTWMTIRPFKDIPVVPDSSWATLYDGSSVATWAGIFHISTPWLISVSWDGINRITIADKNLWATTVYISWDTLSESNCGWYFQRWNNYMFPYSWTITTSNTQVDASEYWPWNYYSSNIFIWPSRSSDSEFSWNTPANPNLRWWETGVQQKQIWNVTEVYVGTTKVRPLTN